MKKLIMLSTVVLALAAGAGVALAGGGSIMGDATIAAGCTIQAGEYGTICRDSSTVVKLNTAKSSSKLKWGSIRAKVTCTHVVGNLGVVGGYVSDLDSGIYAIPPGTSEESEAVVGTPILVYFVEGGDGPDFVSPMLALPVGDTDLDRLPLGFPNVCPESPQSFLGYFAIAGGDIKMNGSATKKQ